MRKVPAPDQYRDTKNKPSPRIIAPVLALLLSGCASGSATETPTQHTSQQPGTLTSCRIKGPDTWQKIPGNFDTSKVANKLHTTPDLVAAGMFGQVACASGVSVRSIAESATVKVEGIERLQASPAVADECLPFLYEVPTVQGAISHEPVVICPASPDLHADTQQ